ncbi:hypothetical protein HDV01_000409 [Terramyces sp. JEL0728]|nr:hypothetical protein HDV01_000409 [Terramyces sp. JEL0728]
MLAKPEPAEYLDPDYDPSKLTISHLCSILSFHSIELPPTKQRKQFYLELWTESLLPRMSEIKQEMENIIPSNEGITLVLPKSKIPILSKSTANLEVEDSPIKKEQTKEFTPVKKEGTISDAKQLLSKAKSFDLAPNQAVHKEDEEEVFLYKEIKRKFETSELNNKKPKYDVEFIKSGRPDLQFKRPPTPSQRKSKLLGDVNNVRLSPTRSTIVSQMEAPKQERFLIKPEMPGLKPRLTEDISMMSVKDIVKTFDEVSDDTIGSDVENEVETIKRKLYPDIAEETFDFDKEKPDLDSEATEDGMVARVVSSIADDQSDWFVVGNILKLAVISVITMGFLYSFYSVHSDFVQNKPISLLNRLGRNRDKVVGYFTVFGKVLSTLADQGEMAIFKYSVLAYAEIMQFYRNLPYSDVITREIIQSCYQLREFSVLACETLYSAALHCWALFDSAAGKEIKEEIIRSVIQLKEFILFAKDSLTKVPAAILALLNQSPLFVKFAGECFTLGAILVQIPYQIIVTLGVGVVVGAIFAKAI